MYAKSLSVPAEIKVQYEEFLLSHPDLVEQLDTLPEQQKNVLIGATTIVFSGMADPERLVHYLQSLGIHPADHCLAVTQVERTHSNLVTHLGFSLAQEKHWTPKMEGLWHTIQDALIPFLDRNSKQQNLTRPSEKERKKPDNLLKTIGLAANEKLHHYQLPVSRLVSIALERGEGTLSESGALVVNTGPYTGRSPDDRFIVDTADIHEQVDWGKVNHPISSAVFDKVFQKAKHYLHEQELFVFDGFCGANPNSRMSVRFINELASHNLFVHQLFIRPDDAQVQHFKPEFTVICAPGLKLKPEEDGVNSEAAIMLNFERNIVLIIGTQYAGEMKKAIFSVMNYRMPEQNVLPMHSSVNIGDDNRSAVFFGLSGTGKTTLSADPDRILVGDDEHGWGEDGLFNFEGGCYAKAIRLSPVTEPEIYQAIRFGAVAENVILNELHEPDYDDASLTENTRIAYPLHYIPNASKSGLAPHPSTIIFLTADAFGVLPPIAKLTAEQAEYHFINGYTSKVAGTELGITEPKAAFSSCFGAPFMPRPAQEYAAMLRQRIQKHNVSVYLINTGWQGGPYGIGKRISIPYTRAMVTAALEGILDQQSFTTDPIFNLQIPEHCPGVPDTILDPRKQWDNLEDYEHAAQKLAHMFADNFKSLAISS